MGKLWHGIVSEWTSPSDFKTRPGVTFETRLILFINRRTCSIKYLLVSFLMPGSEFVNTSKVVNMCVNTSNIIWRHNPE